MMQGNTTPLSIADMRVLTAQMNAATLPRDPEYRTQLQKRIAAAHQLQQHGQETLQTADTWLNKKHPRNVLMATVVFAALACVTEGASKRLNQGMIVFAIAALATIYFLKYKMTQHDAVLASDMRAHAQTLTAFEAHWAAYTSTGPFAAAAPAASDPGPAPAGRG